MPLWQRQKIQTLLRQNRMSVERPRGAIVVLPPAICYRLLAIGYALRRLGALKEPAKDRLNFCVFAQERVD
jgi:hypothetical protein